MIKKIDKIDEAMKESVTEDKLTTIWHQGSLHVVLPFTSFTPETFL